MFRIDSNGAVEDLPVVDAAGDTEGYFSEGNPGIGQKATRVSKDWLNAVQEELCVVIEGAGLSLDKTNQDYDQLLDAIKIIAQRKGHVTITNAQSPYTVLATDEFIEIDATSGNVIINFPSVASNDRRELICARKDNTGNTVTLTADGSDKFNFELASVTLDERGARLDSIANGVATWYTK